MPSDYRIVDVTPEHVAGIHQLTRRIFVYDPHHATLLSEKLFANPRPGVDHYRTRAAACDGQTIGFMQTIVRPTAQRAWLGLFGVAENWRRHGVARRLHMLFVQEWLAVGVQSASVLDLPANYATPGLDPRYTAALCFLEQCGYTRHDECVNLTADLSSTFDTAEDEARLAKAGIIVERAASNAAWPRYRSQLAAAFGDDWALEAESARQNNPPGLHIATQGERLIAFAAHSSQNREWGFFGPMGTLPEARGRGIGRLLLWRCLNDLRSAGHRTAVIPWVGPIRFYSQCIPCRVERVLWRYQATTAALGARAHASAARPRG